MKEKVIQKFKGTVIRKIDKMLIVEVVTYKTHPKYLKKYRSSKRYHVHTESNAQNIGDVVSFGACSPVSKTKKFKIVEYV